jgi:2-C-methyl-D-erythritol 4-phosphate cytidylyltransferase
MTGATDDVSLALAAGFSVLKVEGSYENIKITTPADYDYACCMVGKGIFKYNDGRA